MKIKKEFYWDEDTISIFRFEAKNITKKEILKNISLFVEKDCFVEDNECEKDLIRDLYKQVYNSKKQLFKEWMNSDNVIKLGDKYTFQCIQYKKQFTYKQSYKYWLKEYYYI
mgnify:CR=1 FL=1